MTDRKPVRVNIDAILVLRFMPYLGFPSLVPWTWL
jgi:hypothetical protein